MPRVDHLGVVVDDLDAVVEFFLFLGFEREAAWTAEGDWVGEIIGLDDVRADVVMLRAPDGSGKLELSKFHSPADNEGPQASPSNRLGFRHISIEVDDVDTLIDGLRDRGFDTVGEVHDYEDIYRLCYVRGPEGLIVELAQRIG
jgi:catechol 2,3-dioxygenase-like lactoylglutathione lyase family enzyme